MEELLASIVKLQGDNVVRALQGMLQQAKIALKPANKPSKTRPSHATTSPPAATTDKRALACGIIALLQHSCTPAATAVSSTNDLGTSISEALVDGMRQQPWLWERLIRHHLDYLLQTPEAVDILMMSLHQLDARVVCRSWAVLSSQLRHVDPVVLCSAPALGNFQRAALNQVSSCFRLISRDVLPSGQIINIAGGVGGAGGGGGAGNSGVNNTNRSEVDITLSLQLPAALYTLLYLVGVTDQQGVVSFHSDQMCVDGATAYTSMLLTGMSTPETVYKILQLENLHGQQKSKTTTTAKKSSDGGSKNKKSSRRGTKEKAMAAAAVGDLDDGKGDQEDTMEEEEPKLSMENISKIYATMTTLTVLIEALLTSPQLSQEALPTSETSHHHQQLLPRIAVLLSIRWELAQLLAAAGITPGSSLAKSFIKNAPPLWSLQTCAAILDAAVVCSPLNGGLRPGQQQQLEQSGGAPALTMPPAMLSHALELIQDALLANRVSYTKEEGLEFLSPLVHRVMQVQEACATGVLTPHAAVHAGPGHHVALTAARKLHSLLLAEENMDAVEKKNQQASGQGGSKRSSHAVPAASKKRKKGVVDKGDNGQDAVADLMRMFTSEPLEPPVGAPAATAAATAGVVAGAQKDGRKRITPQAIENPTVILNNPSFTNSLPPGTNNSIKEDGNADDEDDYNGDEIEDDAAPAPAVNGGRGTFGRVVMASTLDMDDATREAAWQAYIADKEQLVEMLGDSAYHEWYDEAEHPLSSGMTGNTGANSHNIDTFFDAIFGGAGEGRKNASLGGGAGDGILFGSVLPQTVLETSLLYPWQAALAASLQLALSILKIIADTGAITSTAATGITVAAVCCQNLVSLEHRKASAAAVLKIVDPTHSRNTWLAASKGAELYPASGSLLHLVHQLRVLLLRTSRRTSPSMLSGYLALARFILETAAEKKAENVSTAAAAGEMATPSSAPTAAAASSKAPWIPLKYVGHIVQSFCCYPPLLAGSFNATSAEALPRVASAGMSSMSDSTAYIAGLLWLIVQSNSRRSIRPDWLNTAIPEARSHPFVAAAPLVQSAAAAELLCQLAEEGVVLTAAVHDNNTTEVPVFTCLMPLIDSCAATAFYLHLELEEQEAGQEAGAVPSAAVLLGHSGSMAYLASLSSILLNCFANSAQELAATLDTMATSTTSDATGKLVEIEQRASFLGIGLEFIEIVSLVAPLLNQAEITASGALLALSDTLNSCTGAQGSCLELLRTLFEDSEAYLAAVRGLENAPVLALPPSASNDDEEEEQDDGEELDLEENDDASDRVELSAYERRKRLKDIRNSYLRVIVAESRRAGDAADGELSDLEDFIVANPERDYGGFIADHFPMAEESGGEEEDSEEEEEEEQIDGAGGQSGGD